MTIYIEKADQIYLTTGWKGVFGPSMLPQSVEEVLSLAELLTYYRVKPKKRANFFLIFEIPRDITESGNEDTFLSGKRLIKK